MNEKLMMVCLATLAGFFLAVAGCGEEDKESCTPGEARFCPCLTTYGVESCNANGDGWSECQCSTTDNDALALALTGHPSSETVTSDIVTISGTTPEGRGDAGVITISNQQGDEPREETIPIEIADGSYSYPITVSPGVNTITVEVFEGNAAIAAVTIYITYQAEAGADGGVAAADAGTATDTDMFMECVYECITYRTLDESCEAMGGIVHDDMSCPGEMSECCEIGVEPYVDGGAGADVDSDGDVDTDIGEDIPCTTEVTLAEVPFPISFSGYCISGFGDVCDGDLFTDEANCGDTSETMSCCVGRDMCESTTLGYASCTSEPGVDDVCYPIGCPIGQQCCGSTAAVADGGVAGGGGF